MLIYNVTLKVDWSIHDQWLVWMKEIHIPEVLETGCFTKNNFCRLLEVDDSEGPTYTSQYFASSKDDYQRYIETYAPRMRQSMFDKFGNHFIAFRTLMELVN